VAGGRLWQARDFRNLWAAQTISRVGNQVSVLALPLTAALTLHAAAWQMGLLAAAEAAPRVGLALVAGVWVDRLPRRPLMLVADIGRAALLATVPLAALLGHLRIEQLFVVALLEGALTVFFDTAYRAYLPSLVTREQLLEGNSKLESSASAAQTVGPSLAGGLVAFAGAPYAVAADAASFAISALLLGRIRASEPPRTAAAQRPHFWRELREGLLVVHDNPMLRAVAACGATWGFFDMVVIAVLPLYVTRDLGMGGVALGSVYSLLGVGLLAGALLSERASRQLGHGPAIVGGATISSLGGVLVAGSGGPGWLAIGVLMGAMFLLGLGSSIYQVNQMALRQALVPTRLLGRMNASMSFGVDSMTPLGAVAGGVLGSAVGLRPTLVVGAIGSVAGCLWVVLSPLRTMRQAPVVVDDELPVGPRS
jgi:MFS family permease